jgi:hypothetical protein
MVQKFRTCEILTKKRKDKWKKEGLMLIMLRSIVGLSVMRQPLLQKLTLRNEIQIEASSVPRNALPGSVASISESEVRLVFRHNYPAKAINCL